LLKTVDEILKELFDLSLSFCLLCLLLPIFMLSMLAIVLESGLPVFFEQVRVGKAGKPFYMRKFRTMRRGARIHELGITTTCNDPRETIIGRFLRRWVIDEMPQLWNVLKGEMSIVGPRPMLMDTFLSFPESVRYERALVKPGITGWAQLHGRNLIPWEERVKYDIEYVKRRNTFWDIFILLASFKLLSGYGLYPDTGSERRKRGEKGMNDR